VRWALANLDEHWHDALRHAAAVRSGAPIAPDDDRLRRALHELRTAIAQRVRK
jgi:hypothetical protein